MAGFLSETGQRLSSRVRRVLDCHCFSAFCRLAFGRTVINARSSLLTDSAVEKTLDMSASRISKESSLLLTSRASADGSDRSAENAKSEAVGHCTR